MLRNKTIGEILEEYAYSEDFFQVAQLENILDARDKTLDESLQGLDDETLEDIGIDRGQIVGDLAAFIKKMEKLRTKQDSIERITIIGGKDKFGRPEDVSLTIEKGSVVSIVGPTGSGKSCLLADIECLAQNDTQTGRQILINDRAPQYKERFGLENKLIAQLTQNMNFVMDIEVGEFLRLHGASRMIKDSEEMTKRIIEEANGLAGEPFAADTPLTRLSGGQSRALMIADTALLSSSPIILLDEIENAGVDRKKALELMVEEGKFVILSTHDPILALMAETRLVIENGGIKKRIRTTRAEREQLSHLEELDQYLMSVRNKLRTGETLERIEQ